MLVFVKPASESEAQASGLKIGLIPVYTDFGRMPRCRVIRVRLTEFSLCICSYREKERIFRVGKNPLYINYPGQGV